LQPVLVLLACAVFAMLFTGVTLNVYSQIGLVLMLGFIAKNDILVVEFANQLRDHGASVRESIEGEMKKRDPDGEGLYHGYYEFWDCDAEQRGPKAAGQTAWMIDGLRGAAKMAEALGYGDEAANYAAAAERSAQ